jgi:hypothetical protein
VCVSERERVCVCERERASVSGTEGVLAGSAPPKACRGASLIRKRLPPCDPPTTLGIGLRQGPSGLRFLMSEVPLCGRRKPEACGRREI